MSIRIAVVLLAMAWAGLAAPATAGETVAVSTFAAASLKGWASRSFSGETRYSFVPDPETGATVLRAVSSDSASGQFRKMEIDLRRTPFLNWSWKVTRTFPGIDEDERAGDDFPARIFVVVERGALGSRSLALNYVWASSHAAGSRWPSPYASRVQLFAASAGDERLGEWVHHKRDVRADLMAAFGEDIVAIDAVALMTDTDDHGGRAETFYGDIWFSAD